MRWEGQPARQELMREERAFHVANGRTAMTTLERMPAWNWGESEHCVQFYETEEFLLDALADYVASGLARGDAAVVIATEALRSGLVKRLQIDAWDVAAAAAAGLYVALDSAEVLTQITVDGTPDPARFDEGVGGIIGRAAEGGRRVRVFGDMVGLLCEQGNIAAAIRLEELGNQLRQTHSVTILCGCPLVGFGREDLATGMGEVCAAHTRVIPGESYTTLGSAAERVQAIALLQQKAQALEAEIAERKRIEATLRESRAALKRSLQMRDEFLAAISHDLRTPLTVLRGQAQLMERRARRGTLDAETIAAGLKQIENRSRVMAELIDELMDVTRLQEGEELPLDRRMVDLVMLVQDVVAGQAEAVNGCRLALDTTETELIGRWDRLRLARAIGSLIGNAIKYSPEGGTITVRLTRETGPSGDCAVLTVQDEGLGIAESDRPHIFERFYRGKNATAPGVGRGLGLTGAWQVVAQHGGAITVESQEGSGSTFTIRLAMGPSAP